MGDVREADSCAHYPVIAPYSTLKENPMPIVTNEIAEQMNAQFQFDEPGFLAKVPYKLTPTNLKGVYLNPTPSDDFDPRTASQMDLIKNGIMIRKPTSQDPPARQQAWNDFFARKLLAKDRIVPQFEVHVGKHHKPKSPPIKSIDGASWLSNAWAGAVTETGTWTTCIGMWTIPTVSEPREPQGTEGGWNSSSWVGIDGWNDPTISSNDVVQAGIEQRVSAAGVPSYEAWYEWFAPPVSTSPPYVWEVGIPNMPVAPGQSVSCTVQYMAHVSATITFVNNTTGRHFSITLAPPPGADFKGNTCEWIMEAPDGGEPTSSLPRFTPVVFTAAIGCGPDDTSTNPAISSITNIVNAQNVTLTQTTVGTDTATISFIG
jgi:Peptidase A4 family